MVDRNEESKRKRRLKHLKKLQESLAFDMENLNYEIEQIEGRNKAAESGESKTTA